MFLAGAASLALMAGCDLPRDSAGTLKRARAGGELRVGVVDNPPWVRVAGERPGGIEPALLQRWAESERVKLRWVPGDLDGHVRALERNEIDLLIAGFTAETPYKSRLGLTQAYLSNRDRIAALDEKAKKRLAKGSRVMAAAPGESALLLSLDRYLLGLGEPRIEEIARGQGRAP
jgi:polar amino acid transport system substrate-binding protein